MRMMLLPLLLVVGLTGIAARETDYCYAFEQDPYLLMGTKTAYQFVRGRSQLPPVPNCTPVQIWMLARHGARYPNKKSIVQLSTLPNLRNQILYNHENRGNGRMCNADLEYLKSAQANPNLTEAMASMLTAQGEQDTRLFAKRLQSAFPELLRPNPQTLSAQDYKFRSTKKERTEATMAEFMDGLFGSRHALPAEVPPIDNDTLLYLYKNCPMWNKTSSVPYGTTEAQRFISGPEYQNLLQNVSRRLGFAYKINNDSVQLMYDMCRYEKAWQVDRLSAWCSVFSKEEMKVLEYLEDLEYYYNEGPGRELSAKLACPLLQDMFNHFRNLERGNFGNEPKGIFYFTHSTTILTFLSALGIGKDSVPPRADNFNSQSRRTFRTSILGPFSGNLIAVFYRCSTARSPNKVMFYTEEMPVLMEGCSVGLCDWDYLKERFGRQLDGCTDLNFCHDPNSATGLHAAAGLVLLAIGLVRAIL